MNLNVRQGRKPEIILDLAFAVKQLSLIQLEKPL